MARFQAVSKQSASVKSLKNKSQIAGADGSVAEIVTEVAIGSVLPCITEEDFASQEGSSSAAATNSSGPSSEIQLTLEDSTPTNAEEVGVVCLTPKCSNALPMEEPLGESPERQKESKSYASLLKASAELEEVGTPSEHVSGVPFVLIPDDNIAAAKEEFKEFIYARFHGDWPAMGRIIGVVNALSAKSGPRIFVHNVGEGEYLLKVTNAKTREFLLSRTCWNVAGYPMFVATWSPDFTPDEAPLTQAVVPVELRNVPYLLFNQESLSRLATAVGKPVSLYPETEPKENFKLLKCMSGWILLSHYQGKSFLGFLMGRRQRLR